MNIITSAHEAVIAVTVAEPTVAIQHAVEAIALNRLVPSAANVRRVNAAVGISELADSIEAHGLIHNLTVRKGKKGRYEVVAGSRRLAALRLLAKEGRLAGNADIPCNVRDAESDTELSLAENVQREAMHIVDEILSYRQLAENGMAPEHIAARFGQSCYHRTPAVEARKPLPEGAGRDARGWHECRAGARPLHQRQPRRTGEGMVR
ncbi:ParB/Srx family N-terminal domain-containing protein [Agrobacterium tumefaciens]|uniref:ParB/RepB/Spo0J family partition protein n=1 Tax=Agrobacterium tumefaciens TaxID=358 RepID=UPI002FD8C64A